MIRRGFLGGGGGRELEVFGGNDVGGLAPASAGVGGVCATGWLRIASVVGVAGVSALTLVLTAPGAAGTWVWEDVVSEPGRTTGFGSLMVGLVLSA